MQKSLYKIQQQLQAFYLWLKNHYQYLTKGKYRKFKCPKHYVKYMCLAILDLGTSIDNFVTISSRGILETILSRLEESRPFLRRDKNMQKKITSAFKAYIKFKSTAQ